MSLRLTAAFLLASLATPALAPVALAADQVPMAAHRAFYDLKLERSRGTLSGARGGMAYELTDACDGWATRQRLQLVITNRDGQDIETISDYATWESKDGLTMRFRMKQTTETAVGEQAEGEARLERIGGPGTIHYTMPEDKEVAIPAGTVFPMAHTEAILAAAEAGKKFITLPVFDGTGTKGAQDSSIAIIDWLPPAPAAYPELAKLSSGRVRIAFFDRGAPDPANDKPAGSPDYEVGMKYWANGVANDLHMDFTDFVMEGKLRELKLEGAPHC